MKHHPKIPFPLRSRYTLLARLPKSDLLALPCVPTSIERALGLGFHPPYFFRLYARPIYTRFACLLPRRTTTAMAPDASHLDDVSPEDFVRRVRELQLERDRQDRERAADLEREILQSREQRRVRRAGE
jgi:hypothetical protein